MRRHGRDDDSDRGDSGAPAGLRALAAAEARRYWRRPWLWLWTAAALAFEGWIVLERDVALFAAGGSFHPVFVALCMAAAWVPAWLCADLLALGYRGNPDPLREPPPAEFLAQAVGRLAPFWTALAVWAGTFAARGLGEAIQPGSGQHLTDNDRHTLPVIASTWAAWTLVFFASGLPYAAAAALASAGSRRPRRWVVALLVAALGMGLENLGLMLLAPDHNLFSPRTPAQSPLAEFLPALGQYPPNLWWGYLSAAQIAGWLNGGGGRGFMEGASFAWTCLLASVSLAACSLPTAAAAWLIAWRRWRRSPTSASPAPPSRPGCPPLRGASLQQPLSP